MVRNIILKVLLLPFSLVYGFFSMMNNMFYDSGLLSSIKFTLPVINIGNLTVGGTGKTPHIEYLINILKPYIKLAVLSRGYKRKTKGFKTVELNDTVQSVGDEPLLFKRKYRDLDIFVSENRVEGVSQLVMEKPEIQTVLLDDAFQHRGINPALNILLTEYEYPFFNDFYLPTGRLREWRSGYKRANIIIVSKCPENITETDKKEFIKKLNLTSKQKVFFSYYKYFNPYYLYDANQRINLTSEISILLISAIASTSYLNTYLESKVGDFHSLEFTDHHEFSFDEMEHIKRIFDSLNNTNKFILTTEKDAMRLNNHRDFILKNKLPVFVLPISVDFLFNEKTEFDKTIKSFLLEFKS